MKREDYYQQIFIYKQRRLRMRKKYGFHTPEYNQKVKRINQKIGIWKAQMRVIDTSNIRVMAIGNALSMFLGYNVRGSGERERDKDALVARGIFFKYCLEHGINGKWLRAYTRDERLNTPTDNRIRFTNSFISIPANKELYNKFKVYIEEIGATSNQ